MNSANQSALVRAIGRWTLAALLINSIIGSGILGLPSIVAGLLGRLSPLGYLAGAALMGVIVACFAEVASQFREAGGPYLYTRAAFGPLIGIEVGWLTWLMRLTATAGGADLFVTYLGELWPAATNPMPRACVLFALVAVLVVVNYVGVGAGANTSNFFTAAKLLLLFTFIAGGLFYLYAGHRAPSPAPDLLAAIHPGVRQWLEALLLTVFAYGGWESGLMPMGEVKNPRRDAPFALAVSLITVSVLITLMQVVVIGVLADPASSSRPVADAARTILGSGAAKIVAAAALVSIFGYLSAMSLNTPRLTYALAERGDFPRFFAAIHPRYHTPYISIVVFGVLLFGVALYGTFRWNIVLSAIARLFGYGLTCAALPVLRRRQPEAGAFRLPAGVFFAAVGVLCTALLALQMSRNALYAVLITMSLALLTWLWARHSRHRA